MPLPFMPERRGGGPVRRVPFSRALTVLVATALAAPAAAGAAPTSPAMGPHPARSIPSAPGEASPDEVVVRYAARPAGSPGVHTARWSRAELQLPARTTVIHLPRGTTVAAELARLRRVHGVLWAVPDYRARIAGTYIPDDEGVRGGGSAGWQRLQWNFSGTFGVGAPEAWANLIAEGRPGGAGVIVAVLDTGVAYARRGPFRKSPDFGRFQFVRGYDFVNRNPFPNDRNGHGTFVASTIAEATNNRYGLTGLAYGVRLMPVRVLDSEGEGEASTIAEGVEYAVRHGAKVINLSLEFSPGVTAGDIPELIEALRYAHRHGVLVVAAAGNEGHTAIAYPARAPYVVSVGATTEHGCLASYSNDGSGLTLVAPGGGADADLPGDPNCRPEAPPGRDIFQVTFTGSSPRIFGLPTGYEGTSMATPHVAATAALVIASGVLGRHPTPSQIVARLRATARKLGGGGDERLYGAGLVDAGAATAPRAPGAPGA
jgi:serine protease